MDSAEYQLMATKAENGRRKYLGAEQGGIRNIVKAEIPIFSFLKWSVTILGPVQPKKILEFQER